MFNFTLSSIRKLCALKQFRGCRACLIICWQNIVSKCKEKCDGTREGEKKELWHLEDLFIPGLILFYDQPRKAQQAKKPFQSTHEDHFFIVFISCIRIDNFFLSSQLHFYCQLSADAINFDLFWNKIQRL